MNGYTIIQLLTSSGDYGGLYATTRKDTENFQKDFDDAFSNLDFDEVVDIQSEADDWLETHKGIVRQFAEIVTTDSL